MSRGPGRVEKTIAKAFAESPSATFSTDDLIALVYPGVEVEKKHRVAVLRAADRVAARLHWEKWQCQRVLWGTGWPNSRQGSLKGRGAVYMNPADVWSYAQAKLRTDYHDGAKTQEEWDAMLGQGGDLHKHVVPGGIWWAWAEQKKAEFASTTLSPELEALIEKHRKESGAFWAATERAFSKPSESEEKRKQRVDAWKRRKKAQYDASICARCGRALDPAEPITRDFVSGGQAPLTGGWRTFVEIRCMDCATAEEWRRRGRSYERPCLTCGRPVHQVLRISRRRTFCCTLHQRRWYRTKRH
jgi:hypothetical protein